MIPVNSLIYVIALAAGVWLFVDLYLFTFDRYSEKELIRLAFYWAPLMLFGLLGLVGRALKTIRNHFLFALVGALIGIIALAGFLMVAFLS